jgi:hypothetical protein
VLRSEDGQSTVELVALLPLLALLALACLQALAAGAAGEAAQGAAEAGAVALVQGADPKQAAREALSSGSRKHAEISVAQRRVSVEVRPLSLVPGVAELLVAHATADAGKLR